MNVILTIHPLAALFPAMPPSELSELAEDIKSRHLDCPITLYEGKILDGRHRYKACNIAGEPIKTEEYTGNDPLGFVISRNLHRRHLTTSQRAMIAAEIAKLPANRPSKSSGIPLVTQSEAAKSLRVSTDSVKAAKKVAEASPEAAKKVLNGEISLNAAKKEIEAKAKPEVHKEKLDATGYPVPEVIEKAWDEATDEAKALLGMMSKIRSAVKCAQDNDVLHYREITHGTLIADLNQCYHTISLIKPYAVCPACQGKTFKTCSNCKKRGFVSKFKWENQTRDEDKALRSKVVKASK